jgi:hypothetical protein
MNIETVIYNLERTIEGKQLLRNSYAKERNPFNTSPVMIAVLDNNINELKTILIDVKAVRTALTLKSSDEDGTDAHHR